MIRIFRGRLRIVRMAMLLAAIALVCIGIVSIYASEVPADTSLSSPARQYHPNNWKRQAAFAVLAFAGVLLISFIDYRWLGSASYWLYGLVLIALAVLILGKYVDLKPFVRPINNTYRWIQVGFAGRFLPVQPSEFCKVAHILALAWYLRYRSNYRRLSGLIGPFALTLLAMVLIIQEPDLGTVLLMMPVLFAMLFVAGARVKHLAIILVMALLSVPLLWGQLGWYQRSRISCVLLQSNWISQKAQENPGFAKILTGKPHFDKTAWNRSRAWQLKQSKLAIASGGLAGYGFRRGPYLKGHLLPERHNDFIFSIIAHQWGFWGCMAIFTLYSVIFICGIEIAINNTDPFARLIAVGIIVMFAVEVIVNTSMTVGLMPITGLTLPLVSYGGSSLVVSMGAIGLLNNVGRARPFTVAGKGLENY